MSAHPQTGPSGPTSAGPEPLAIMIASMAGALVLIGVVLAVLGAELVAPPTWVLLVLGLACAAALAIVVLMPVPRAIPGQPVRARVLTTCILRVTVLEAPAILGLALTILGDPMSLLTYLLPAMFSLVGIWLFARPSVVRARLERA
ncbi:hypothetical protein [Ornithinimicrobium panacihumi]|uniref:hypothetical protein n=1 Tax=Ornithinimicrobium panacihumi TaxID=2008449 RepID=UPI003F8AD955